MSIANGQALALAIAIVVVVLLSTVPIGSTFASIVILGGIVLHPN
jgi:hypothetical protein